MNEIRKEQRRRHGAVDLIAINFVSSPVTPELYTIILWMPGVSRPVNPVVVDLIAIGRVAGIQLLNTDTRIVVVNRIIVSMDMIVISTMDQNTDPVVVDLASIADKVVLIKARLVGQISGHHV